MFPNKLAIILFYAACLAACSASPPEQQSEQQSPAAANAPVTPAPALEAPKQTEVAETPIVKITEPKAPGDVHAFIKKRDGCDHFRGEEPYDQERGAFLEKAMKDNCAGTDTELRSLRERYKTNKDISNKLKNYEDTIEVAP